MLLRSPRKFLILQFLRGNPSTRGEVARECLQGSEDPKNLASTLLHRYEREGIVEKGGGKYSLTSKGEDRIEYMRGGARVYTGKGVGGRSTDYTEGGATKRGGLAYSKKFLKRKISQKGKEFLKRKRISQKLKF